MNIFIFAGIIALIGIIIVCLFKYHSQVWKALKSFGHWAKHIKIQAFTIPIAVVFIVVFYIFAPDKMYYFIFLAVFSIGLYMLIHWLMDYIYVISLDWTGNEMMVFELSTRAFNNYKVIDECGKTAFLQYWLKCRSGKIALVDRIDQKEKIIVLNPTISNFEFTKKYKDADMMIKKSVNELFNQLAELEGKFEYETIKKAKEILKRSALLSTIAEATQADAKGESQTASQPQVQPQPLPQPSSQSNGSGN